MTDANLPLAETVQASGVNTGSVNQAQAGGAGAKNRFVTILQGEYEENPEANPDMKPERLSRIRQRRSSVTARELDAWLRQHGMDRHFILVEKAGHGGVIPAVINTAVQAAMHH